MKRKGIMAVEFPGPMTKEQRENIRAEIQEICPNRTVLVLSEGGRLSPVALHLDDDEPTEK